MVRAQFLTRIIFSVVFVFLNFESFAQIKSTYNTENFIVKLDLDFKSLSSEYVDNETFKNTKYNYLYNLDKESQEYFIDIVNYTKGSSEKEFLSFFYYTNWILNNNIKNNSSINKILMYHYYVLYNPEGNKKNYFTSLWNKIISKTFVEESSHRLYVKKNFKVGIEDFLDYGLYDNSGNVLGTLVFSLVGSDIFIESEYHRFKIEKPNFNYYPDINYIDGFRGRIKSSINNKQVGDIEFALKNFSIDLKSGKVVSNEVVLNANKLKNVNGALEYLPPKSQPKHNNLFGFISDNSNVNITIKNNIRLTSGVSLNGDFLYSNSLSNNYSELLFLLKNGKKISVYSKSFLIEDSFLSSTKARFKLYDNLDSIYHPMVEFDFNVETNKIQALNINGILKNSPFYSSYFDIEFDPDELSYTIGDENIYFGMVVAPNQRPLSVYSQNYFSNQKLNEMTDLNGINVLKAVFTYSSKIRRKDFYLNDLAIYFKMKPMLVEAGLISLWKNGFISYEREIGLIKILPKLRHYYYSHLKRSDFDEFSFNSLSRNSNNLRYNINTNTMLFMGVQSVTLSKKNNIVVYPNNGSLVLKKNREVNTIGDISVGNFDFKSVDLVFDYDSYLIDLKEIDTLKMLTKKDARDSYNYLYNIGGDLFINHPKNKSSRRNLPKFPSFISDKSTRIFFDMPEEYGEKYDSSFYFSIDQFRIDSLDKSSLPKFEFPGTFYSSNIIKPLEAKLITMPDNSFGFTMGLQDEGLGAYNEKIYLYNNLLLDSTGLYVNGNIKYNTTTLFSEKIRLFPDSISGIADKGYMLAGKFKNKTINYPQIELTNLDFRYYNEKDEYFYFQYDSILNSKITGYDNKAEIIGDLVVSSNKVSSYGEIKSNNSTFISDDFSYNNNLVVSEMTQVKIYTPNHKNGLLSAEGVFFKYDLINNEMEFKSPFFDESNFILPEYELSTSLTNAIWEINNKTLNLRADEKEIHSVYPLNSKFDNWEYISKSLLVDINNKILLSKGVPDIQIADAYIIPNNEELYIKEKFQIQPLSKSVLILDTISEFHRFVDLEVSVLSKNKFEGQGVYEYVNFDFDTFNIPFSQFEIKSGSNGDLTSFSTGEVSDLKPILMEPGFNFYGSIELLGNNEQLLFDGNIIPSEVQGFSQSNAIPFNDYFVPGDELVLTISDGDGFYNAAISKEEKNLFFDFFNNSVTKKSLVFFNPEGLLSYDPFTKDYLIETEEKRNQDVYNGNSLLYNPVNNSVAFEGSVSLINNDNNFKIFSSMSGNLNLDSMNIESDVFMIMDINLKKSIIDELGFAFNDIIETYGAPIAHDNEQDVLVRLSDLIGNDKTVAYENIILSEYKSLIEADGIINNAFVFPNTKFTWSSKESSWYNTSTINLSNIGPRDVNASIDGFLEIKNIDEYQSLVNVFLQPAPEFWVFLSYDGKNLTTLSSNDRYNSEMSEITSTRDKFVSIRIADENNVLDYINNFRLKYFGIKEPYNLMSPSDTFLEDEIFKTVSDDDDGF